MATDLHTQKSSPYDKLLQLQIHSSASPPSCTIHLHYKRLAHLLSLMPPEPISTLYPPIPTISSLTGASSLMARNTIDSRPLTSSIYDGLPVQITFSDVEPQICPATLDLLNPSTAQSCRRNNCMCFMEGFTSPPIVYAVTDQIESTLRGAFTLEGYASSFAATLKPNRY